MHVVEYKLRFALGSTTLRILKIEEKADSNTILEFNNAFCESKRESGFCTEISDLTRIPVFGVPLTKGSTIHKVLFCEFAVGNSLFVSNRYATELDLPAGADSFIVKDTDTAGYLTDAPQDIREFSYIMKSRARILPIYEVTFEYDEEFERKSRGRVVCNRCTEQDAVVFCPSERANFCGDCDEKVHADIFLQRHERKYFSEVGQKKFFCCLYHPTKTVEYFCDECREPLCTECKISGSHSLGESSRHVITPFVEACKGAVQRVAGGKPQLEESLTKMNAEMECYLEGLGGFKTGIVAVRKQLEKEFRTLMQQLEVLENQQMQAINAKLVGWFYHSQSLKQMLEYPKVLDPADLLVSLKSIEEHRKHEKPPRFGQFSGVRPELHGKITLGLPKAQIKVDVVRDNTAVDWRIKTMHIAGNSATVE